MCVTGDPDLRRGIAAVSRRTLLNAGSVVDDVLVAAGIHIFRFLALIMEVLHIKQKETRKKKGMSPPNPYLW